MEEYLRYHRERGGGPGLPAARRSLSALALLCAVAVPGLSGAAPAHAAPLQAAADTTRTPSAPFHFRKSISLDTEYLSRVLQGAPVETRVAIEVDPPEEPGGASTFAKRYGIPRDLAQKIDESARAEGVDPELGFRLVRVESRFRILARGPQGALGLVQLMPGTARSIDRSLRTEAQILEPAANLRTGFRYLRRMIERYDGNVRLALLAYNRGEGSVDRALRNGRDPENGYSHRVLGTRGSDPYRGSGVLKRDAAR